MQTEFASSQVWWMIVLGALCTNALRAVPFMASRWLPDELPPGLVRFFEFSGIAIVGCLMGEAIFAPQRTAEIGLRAFFTVLAFALMLKLKKPTLCLLLAFLGLALSRGLFTL
ncbi:AzlD domain-containing protein [Cystobacter fuscus]|uniref:AzlD domain-containing protein n=1 Tax=Cystobacter fuscus TaxID=43 RepID=UPI002B2FD449|nr:hypothetical protein F0U63_42190 [Cystobacter fuscus]